MRSNFRWSECWAHIPTRAGSSPASASIKWDIAKLVRPRILIPVCTGSSPVIPVIRMCSSAVERTTVNRSVSGSSPLTSVKLRSETKLVMTLLRPSPDGCALASRRTDVPCYTGPSLKPGISQLEAAQEGTSYLSRYSDPVNALTKIISVHGYMRAINSYSAFRKA